MKNKFTLIILTFAILLSNITFAKETESLFTEEAQVLINLQILNGADNTQLELEKGVTKSEFLAMLIHMLGNSKDNLISSDKLIFYDVFQGHWARGYIETALALGIISGNGDGYFYPEKVITYDEAVKMTMSALGYKELANAKGGYPMGYIALANEKGLLQSLNVTSGNNLTKNDAVKLIYNALEIEIVYQVSFNSDGTASFKISKDKTVLSHYLKVKKVKGIVSSNEFTSLTSSSYLLNNHLMINGTSYTCNFDNANALLGYNIEAYIKEDDKTKTETIIYAMKDKKNKDLTIKAKELDFENGYFSMGTIVYKNDKDQEFKAHLEDADIILNNSSITDSYDKETFNIKNGEIKLIDNDGDSKYEVAFIKTYKNMVVSYIDDKEIIDTYGNKLSLPQGVESKITFKDALGKKIDKGSIVKDMVLSVYESRTKEIYEIYVSKEIKTGVISLITTDKDGMKIVVGDKEYTVCDEFLKTDEYMKRPAKASDYATCYLNYEGKIARMKFTNSEDTHFGFLTKAAYSTNTANDEALLRVYTSNGVFETLKMKEDVTFLDESGAYPSYIKINSADFVSNKLKRENGKIAGQMIAYKLTENGLIRYIEIESSTNDNALLKWNANLKDVFYKRYGLTLDLRYAIDEKTVVFEIPRPDASGEYQEKYFKMKSYTNFIHDQKYTVDIYNANSVNTASIIRLYPSGGIDTSYETNFGVVSDISSAIDDDGVSAYKIYLLYKGKLTGYLVDSDFLFIKHDEAIDTADKDSAVKSLKKGDIIALSLNSTTNKITLIKELYKVDNGLTYGITKLDKESGNGVNGLLRAYKGMAIAKENTTVLVTDKTNTVPVRAMTYTYVYKIDLSGSIPKISVSTIDAVKSNKDTEAFDGSKILVTMTYSQVNDIFIINE